MLLTPLQCVELSKCKNPKNFNTSSLKKIFTGGYLLHKDFLHDLWKLLPGELNDTENMSSYTVSSVIDRET